MFYFNIETLRTEMSNLSVPERKELILLSNLSRFTYPEHTYRSDTERVEFLEQPSKIFKFIGYVPPVPIIHEVAARAASSLEKASSKCKRVHVT